MNSELEMIADREIKRDPSTLRTKLLKERYLKEKLTICPERAIFYTESMKETEGQPIVIRRAKAFKHVLQNITSVIGEGELIVGSQTRYVRGAPLFPELASRWMKDTMEKVLKEEEQLIEFNKGGGIQQDFVTFKIDFDAQESKNIKEVIDYWLNKSFGDIAREFFFKETYKTKELEALESHLVMTPFVVALLEGRVILDFEKVLTKGFKGIIEEIEKKLEHFRSVEMKPTLEDMNKVFFWTAGKIVCEGMIAWAENYAKEAERQVHREENPTRKEELKRIAKICRWVPAHPARGFYEALQSFWFTFLGGLLECGPIGNAPGRFDQYIYPFYQKDIQRRKITREETIELLECLRVKHTEIQRALPTVWEGVLSQNTFQNLVLGGCTSAGEDASNELSILILEAAINMQTNQPTLSIRYNDKLNDMFLLKAVELVKTGVGMPAWFNDKVAIPHLLNHFKASLEDARDWAIGGCSDLTIPAKSYSIIPIPLGFTNIAKFFELTLYNGKDHRSGKQLSIKTGDVSKMSYEKIMEAFKKQTRHLLQFLTSYSNMTMGFHPHTVPLVYTSLLTSDCLERGKGLDEEGARYNQTVSHFIVGAINVVNSLAAIKKCVFEDKSFTMRELMEALKANFKGKESINRALLNAPKFGNNDPYVDKIASEIYRYIAEQSLELKSYLGYELAPSAYSVTTHPVFGKAVGALPDGRPAGVPLCDGSVSAFPGTDVTGPTSLINSASKIDASHYKATQLNMKFHPTALEGIKGSMNLISLIKTYFDQAGYFIQFNVIDNKMLVDAQKHPENYRNLLVRVAGFTAYWVELSPLVQGEIIRRTEYGNL